MKTITTAAGVILIILIILSFRPLPQPSMDNSQTIQGVVDTVFNQGATGDIGLYMRGTPVYFYINQGSMKGLKTKDLLARLSDQNITLRYTRHWTPLDPLDKHKHISEITLGDDIIYSELNH